MKVLSVPGGGGETRSKSFDDLESEGKHYCKEL